MDKALGSSRDAGVLALGLLAASQVLAATGADVATRMASDAAAGRPLVAHVVVALCDNEHQGIVPVPGHLGNGQSSESNLYWGAAYGVRTFLANRAGWRVAGRPRVDRDGVLDRIVFAREEVVDGKPRTLYLVAEAWEGSRIRESIQRFLSMTSGLGRELVPLEVAGRRVELSAGGDSHLIVFVGHNGLMDFPVPATPAPAPARRPRSSVVLACASRPYFLETLVSGGSHPLLLTTGLMAPEAYTLDAVVRAWFTGRTSDEVRDAAAEAYSRFQKCGLAAARRLFAVQP